MMEVPDSVRPGARNCGIRIRQSVVETLRESIGGNEGRRAAYAFLKPEVKAVLDDIYLRIGSPKITVVTAWTVFDAMVAAVRS